MFERAHPYANDATHTGGSTHPNDAAPRDRNGRACSDAGTRCAHSFSRADGNTGGRHRRAGADA
ncbi:MAG: hypothetical protein OXL97_14670 [Chloroflexota bacterium]|nr:hypothetical protein [Chloroflexota bacterium]MDE2886127.1 hypothetical protein [Chloroflexota bacterium]